MAILQWPPPGASLTEIDIEKILIDSGLKFTPPTIRDIFLVVEQYRIDKYLLEEQKIKKAAQLKQLQELVEEAEGFRRWADNFNVNLYVTFDHMLLIRARKIAEEIKHALKEAIERTCSSPTKKGRKIQPARLLLIQKLIATFEKETEKNFIQYPGHAGYYKDDPIEYTKYDPDTVNFIFCIICALEPKYNKNRLQKDIANILKKH